MLNWNNLDTTRAFEELKKAEKVDLTKAMVGESGGERVRKYHVPMAARRWLMSSSLSTSMSRF